jgi:signal peptidase I
VRQLRSRSLPRDYIEAAVVAVLLSVFVRTFLFEAFKIPTPSMETSLLVGDHIIVDKFGFGPRLSFEGGLVPIREIGRGDIVIFRFEREPEKDYVKRVIGLPGDVVKVEQKRVFVNDQALEESYVQHIDETIIPERDYLPPVKVPPGHYFVMGDNRDNSADSREWGFVPREQIAGRALFVYWSLRQPSEEASATASGLGSIFPATRWDRVLRAIR